jgi:dipeptide/tripeptide permease
VYVQDTISWSLGFALPAAAMASAVLLFLAGSANYRHVMPTESPMARVVKVVAAALKNRCGAPHPQLCNHHAALCIWARIAARMKCGW